MVEILSACKILLLRVTAEVSTWRVWRGRNGFITSFAAVISGGNGVVKVIRGPPGRHIKSLHFWGSCVMRGEMKKTVKKDFHLSKKKMPEIGKLDRFARSPDYLDVGH